MRIQSRHDMGTRDSKRSEGISPELAAKLASAPFVIGSDEVGLGAWAGPLVVVGVLVPGDWVPPTGLTDSKAMTEAARERLFDELVPHVRHLVTVKSAKDLDRDGVGKSLIQMHRVVHLQMRRGFKDAICVADGNLTLGDGIISAKRADGNVAAVSAASVVAKVVRDRMMVNYDGDYPGYNFRENKGYGGDENHAHTIALRKLGPCAIHRRSYKPVADVVREKESSELQCGWEIEG